MTAHALEVDGLTIGIGARALMRDLDFRVEPGCATTVMGPSGAGKSTLLAYIGGHLDPAFCARGRVTVDGSDVTALPPERRAIGVLFQDDLLFPHLSVGANVAFGLDPSVRGRAARQARVDAALADAGLAGFADRDPATLSGGQRSRVALMRTLVAAPKALLLDEPFAKLDSALRREFQRFVFDEAARRGLPVLLVTHDPADARAAGGPILRLDECGVATRGA
jgi:putative thiamine transport system ATP-binding protein